MSPLTDQPPSPLARAHPPRRRPRASAHRPSALQVAAAAAGRRKGVAGRAQNDLRRGPPPRSLPPSRARAFLGQPRSPWFQLLPRPPRPLPAMASRQDSAMPAVQRSSISRRPVGGAGEGVPGPATLRRASWPDPRSPPERLPACLQPCVLREQRLVVARELRRMTAQRLPRAGSPQPRGLPAPRGGRRRRRGAGRRPRRRRRGSPRSS